MKTRNSPKCQIQECEWEDLKQGDDSNDCGAIAINVLCKLLTREYQFTGWDNARVDALKNFKTFIWSIRDNLDFKDENGSVKFNSDKFNFYNNPNR